MVIVPDSITLGILAGGRATRLDGLDKAWLERDGVPQVVRIARRLESHVATVIASANRNLSRYVDHGITTVADDLADAGPMGGLDAISRICRTPWLLTVPVDVMRVSEYFPQTLAAEAGTNGAFAIDDDGPQPLVALWRVEGLRKGITSAIASRAFAIHVLQKRLKMPPMRCVGIRFGNLNTPADLIAAGMDPHE